MDKDFTAMLFLLKIRNNLNGYEKTQWLNKLEHAHAILAYVFLEADLVTRIWANDVWEVYVGKRGSDAGRNSQSVKGVLLSQLPQWAAGV